MRLLLVALGVLVCVGPARAQEAGCARDTDCKGARICQNRVCVEPPAQVVCGRDLDCPGDDICVDKKCSPPAPANSTNSTNSTNSSKKKKAAAAAAAVPAAPPASAPPAAPAPLAPSGPVADPGPVLLVLPANPLAPVATTPAPAPSAAPIEGSTAPPAVSAPASAAPYASSAALSPPPLVAAPVTIRRVEDTPGGPGSPVFGISLGGGLHRWAKLDRSEGDFGLSLTGAAGLRATDNLSLLGLIHGDWTMMADTAATLTSAASSNNGLLLGIGLGVRLDHLGPIPGYFTASGLASFGSIVSGADKVAGLDLSGGALLVQYSQPLSGWLGAHAQLAWHFLSKDFSLVTLSLGVTFGN